MIKGNDTGLAFSDDLTPLSIGLIFSSITMIHSMVHDMKSLLSSEFTPGECRELGGKAMSRSLS